MMNLTAIEGSFEHYNCLFVRNFSDFLFSILLKIKKTGSTFCHSNNNGVYGLRVHYFYLIVHCLLYLDFEVFL